MAAGAVAFKTVSSQYLGDVVRNFNQSLHTDRMIIIYEPEVSILSKLTSSKIQDGGGRQLESSSRNSPAAIELSAVYTSAVIIF